MTDLKKFLDPLSSFQRFLYVLVFSFLVLGGLLFCIPLMAGGFPLAMLTLPLGVFAAFGTFICWMFRRSLHAYDSWWSSLTDADQAAIEQDFRQARQVSRYLFAGPRYAYIRQTGRVVSYDQLDRFDYRCSTAHTHCVLHILLKDASKVCVDLPSLAEAESLRDDLLSYQVLVGRTD